MKKVHLFRIAALGCLSFTLGACAGMAERPAPQKIEQSLIDNWTFFKLGDANKDGVIDREEFWKHPSYVGSGWENREKSFIFWMIDDDKSQSLSLQEWFNNELGQFVLGDADHDGVLSVAEQTALHAVEEKLFRDLGLQP